MTSDLELAHQTYQAYCECSNGRSLSDLHLKVGQWKLSKDCCLMHMVTASASVDLSASPRLGSWQFGCVHRTLLKAGRFEMLPGCSTAPAGAADKPDAEQPTNHPGGHLQVDGAALDNLEVHALSLKRQQIFLPHGMLNICPAVQTYGAVLRANRMMDNYHLSLRTLIALGPILQPDWVLQSSLDLPQLQLALRIPHAWGCSSKCPSSVVMYGLGWLCQAGLRQTNTKWPLRSQASPYLHTMTAEQGVGSAQWMLAFEQCCIWLLTVWCWCSAIS